MSENAAAQIGPEVALDPRGDATPHWVRLGSPVRGRSRDGAEPAGRAASGWGGAGGRQAHSLFQWAEGAALIERLPMCAATWGASRTVSRVRWHQHGWTGRRLGGPTDRLPSSRRGGHRFRLSQSPVRVSLNSPGCLVVVVELGSSHTWESSGTESRSGPRKEGERPKPLPPAEGRVCSRVWVQVVHDNKQNIRLIILCHVSQWRSGVQQSGRGHGNAGGRLSRSRLREKK